MLKFEWWHGVDGSLFEGIDGTGVFLGVGETAVSEDAGNRLDVGAVAQQVRSATVAGAVPGDVLFFLAHVAFDFFGQLFHFGINQEISRCAKSALIAGGCAFSKVGDVAEGRWDWKLDRGGLRR